MHDFNEITHTHIFIKITALLTSLFIFIIPHLFLIPHLLLHLKHASLLTNSSLYTSLHNKSTHIPVPLTPSPVIENIDTST